MTAQPSVGWQDTLSASDRQRIRDLVADATTHDAIAPVGGGSRSSSRNCDGNTGEAGTSIDVLNPVVLVFHTTATRTLDGVELGADWLLSFPSITASGSLSSPPRSPHASSDPRHPKTKSRLALFIPVSRAASKPPSKKRPGPFRFPGRMAELVSVHTFEDARGCPRG